MNTPLAQFAKALLQNPGLVTFAGQPLSEDQVEELAFWRSQKRQGALRTLRSRLLALPRTDPVRFKIALALEEIPPASRQKIVARFGEFDTGPLVAVGAVFREVRVLSTR